jgi:hypothetical protein
MTASTNELDPQVRHPTPDTTVDALTTAFPVILAVLQQTYATVVLVGPDEAGLLSTLVLLFMLATRFAATVNDAPLPPVTPAHVTLIVPLEKLPVTANQKNKHKCIQFGMYIYLSQSSFRVMLLLS